MSSGDGLGEVDMDTGLSIVAAADTLKDEMYTEGAHASVEFRTNYASAKLGSRVQNSMLQGEDDTKGANMDEAKGKQESCTISDIMNASNLNEESKQSWGASDEHMIEGTLTEDHIFDREDILQRINDGKDEIVEETGASSDALVPQERGNDGHAVETEKIDSLVETGLPKHLRNQLISYVRVNEGHDTALLIQGVQQSSASPLRSLHTSSLASETWLRHFGSNSSQQLVEDVDGSMDGGYRPGDNFLRTSTAEDRHIDGIFSENLEKDALLPTMSSSLQQPRQMHSTHFERLHPLTYKGCSQLIDPVSGQVFASHDSQAIRIEDSIHENKALTSDNPLRRVLSDAFTGLLMDDAMVAHCGHSFGISSLHRVMETNLCLSCGAAVPPGSLIPNYALRAAVQAYKREEQSWPNSFKGPKRRRDHLEQPESSDGKKVLLGSNENAGIDGSRPKGVQFPFVVNDRVLIKGNKRTPERFVGREAVITTQCLNGWYLVRTLDNGESVRLQYRSLQKLGDGETPSGLETGNYIGQSGDTVHGADGCSGGQSSTSVPTSLSDDRKEDGSKSNFNDRMAATSSPSGISKGLRTDFMSRTSRDIQRGRSKRGADLSGASWLSGGTSSNSSQELEGEQMEEQQLNAYILQEHDKAAHERRAISDPAQNGLNAPSNVSDRGNIDRDIGGSSPEAGCSLYQRNTKGCELQQEVRGCAADGKHTRKDRTLSTGRELPDNGTSAESNEGNNSMFRSKRSVVEVTSTHLTGAMDLPESDPYRKVYVSGSRRRGVGDEHMSMSRKQSASTPLDTNVGNCSILQMKVLHEEPEAKISGDIAHPHRVAYSCEAIKAEMVNLESEIPWSCMHDIWKGRQQDWLRKLQASKTAKDVVERLQEFRDALLLMKAGNMGDEEWNKHLNMALQSEEMDVIAFLWGQIHEDVSKWIESKPKRNRKPLSIKSEFIDMGDIHKLFPQLCIGGLSCAGISTATSVAAAEAFADGQQDTEALLAVPMKLIREHSKQDLLAVREAIEREKRHIAAKLMQLEASVIAKEDSKDEAGEVVVLIENPKQFPASPALLTVEEPFTTLLSNDLRLLVREQCMNLVEPSPQDGGQVKVFPLEDADGEATDLSDSD